MVWSKKKFIMVSQLPVSIVDYSVTVSKTISQDLPLAELERMCRSKISDDLWRFIGPAETGSTYHRNIESFGRFLLKQRLFQGISSADISLELFGQRVKTPILVDPIGNFSRISNEAEVDVVAGALEAGSMVFIAHSWQSSLEKVVASPHPPLVLQSLFTKDFEELKAKVKLAENLGFAAVGLTVDTVVTPKFGDTVPYGTGWNLKSPTIEDVRKLRKETSLPFFVKGIMCEEDALLAVEAGADTVVVSNHGGRILDYSRATVEVLPEIVKAVGSKAGVLMDGGIRRGSDVLKALALGARATLIGRPIFWGVTVGGAEGVSMVIKKLSDELVRSMVICGVKSLEEANEKILLFAEQ